MHNHYWIEFPASKVRNSSKEFFEHFLQKDAEAVLAATKPKMKKFLGIFNEGMETWREAFDRVWNEWSMGYRFPTNYYFCRDAENLYEQACKLKDDEIMWLDSRMAGIVTYFD